MSDNPFGLPGTFNLNASQQAHLLANGQQQNPTGVPPGKDGALWNQIQHQFVQHTAQMNNTAQQMLYQQPQQQLQQHLQPNQNPNVALAQQLRVNPAAVAAAAAQQNQVGSNPSILGMGNPGSAQGGLGNGMYNLAAGRVPPELANEFQALSRAQQNHHNRPPMFSGQGQPNVGQQQPNGLSGLNLAQMGQGMDALQAQNQRLALMRGLQSGLGGVGANQQGPSGLTPQQIEMIMRQRQQQQQSTQQPGVQSLQSNNQQFNANALQAAQMQQQNSQNGQQRPTGMLPGGFPFQRSPQIGGQQTGQDERAAALRNANQQLPEQLRAMPLEDLKTKLVAAQQKLGQLETQVRQLSMQNPPPPDLQRHMHDRERLRGLMTQMFQFYKLKMDEANAASSQGGQQGGPGPSQNGGGPSGQQNLSLNAQDNRPNPLIPNLPAWAAGLNPQQIQQHIQNSQLMHQAQMRNMNLADAQTQQGQSQQSLQNPNSNSATTSAGQENQTNMQQMQQSPPQPTGLAQGLAAGAQQNGGQGAPWDAFFRKVYLDYINMRKMRPDVPTLDGKPVELGRLFLVVGAFGGFKAVTEQNLWQDVGGRIGYVAFAGPKSNQQVAEILKECYQRNLADFEQHWNSSLRDRDPQNSFPLPPHLQGLRSSIENLRKQLPQPNAPQQASDQAPRPPSQGGPSAQTQHAIEQQQNLLMRTHPSNASTLPNQPPNQQPPALSSEHFASMKNLFMRQPELLRLQFHELKAKQNWSDEQIGLFLRQREIFVAHIKHQQMQQQVSLQGSQQSQQTSQFPPNTNTTPQMQPVNRPPSVQPGSAQPGLLQHSFGMGQGQTQQTQQLSMAPNGMESQSGGQMSSQSGMGGAGQSGPSAEQIEQATNDVRQVLTALHNRFATSSIGRNAVDLPREQQDIIIARRDDVMSLVAQVKSNLPLFRLLRRENNAMNEMIPVAELVVYLTEQYTILAGPTERRRFFFSVPDLKNAVERLTAFLMALKTMQSRINMEQGPQRPPSGQPPAPPGQMPQIPPDANHRPMPPQLPIAEYPRPPSRQQPPPNAPLNQTQSSASASTPAPPQRPPTATSNPANKLKKQQANAPAVSSPSPAAASTPINQAATPAPMESPNTPKSPVTGSKVPTSKSKPPVKPKQQPRRPSKSTPKLANAEVSALPKQEPERPSSSSKRNREEESQQADKSNGRSSSPKRPRVDPQLEVDAKRAEDVQAAGVSIPAAQKFIDDSYDLLKATGTVPNQFDAPDRDILHTLLDLVNQGGVNTAQTQTSAAADTLGDAFTVSAKDAADGPEPDETWLWGMIDASQLLPDEVPGGTPDLVQSSSSQGRSPTSDEEQPAGAGAATSLAATSGSEKRQPTLATTESPEYWANIGSADARYFTDDSSWKWEGEMPSGGDWPVTFSST